MPRRWDASKWEVVGANLSIDIATGTVSGLVLEVKVTATALPPDTSTLSFTETFDLTKLVPTPGFLTGFASNLKAFLDQRYL